MDNKKKLLIGLLIIAIGVWGYNLYQFRASTAAEYQVPEKTVQTVSDAVDWDKFAVAADSFEYTGTGRDPFAHRLFVVKKTAPKKAVKKPEKPVKKKRPPKVTLQGIMGSSENARAILLDKGGKTHISKVGDVVSGMTVLEIGKKQVVMDFEGETIEVALPKK